MTTMSNPASHVDERLGLLGRKVGMMRIFTAEGDAIPVTVLDVSNNRVAQVKTPETDGYSALQVVFGEKKASRVSKPEAGHLAKAGVVAGEMTKEFRVAASVAAEYKPGAQVPVGVFAVGQMVDVQGSDHRIVVQDERERAKVATVAMAGHGNRIVVRDVRPAPGSLSGDLGLDLGKGAFVEHALG